LKTTEQASNKSVKVLGQKCPNYKHLIHTLKSGRIHIMLISVSH